MRIETVKSTFSFLIVIVHVMFVAFCALYLRDKITKFETYISTITVFLPIFGIYVGIIVKNIKLNNIPSEERVSPTFVGILSVLFVAYLIGNILVLYGYGSGFITSEDLLPGAISIVEAAFGGFFTSLFLTLFAVKSD